MKLKYYLRGLGVGILVTAIIMSFTKEKKTITDAEIKIRAAELGMVEKSVLADLQDTQENLQEGIKDKKANENNNEGNEAGVFPEDANETNTNSEIINQEENLEGYDGEDVKDSKLEKNKETLVNTNQKEEKEQTEETIKRYVVISVTSGNGSELVSRKLYEAGLVDSAVQFNRFLVANGYAKILRAGDHAIPIGATKEEMAKILCDLE